MKHKVNRRDIVIRGTVRVVGTGDPVFGAKICHGASGRAATSGTDGRFRIDMPNADIKAKIRLVIVCHEYWPARVTVRPVSSDATTKTYTLDDTSSALKPISTAWSNNLSGRLLSWCGPRLLYHFMCLSRREQLLVGVILLFLLLPLSIVGCDFGWRIPMTQSDDWVREQIQRVPWLPSNRTEVRYEEVRKQYYSGVRYALPRGDYTVTESVQIDIGATLRLEAGTTLRFEPRTGIMCNGQMIATGQERELIRFIRKQPTEAWNNISFWGVDASGSSLTWCSIEGGSGHPILGSETGGFSVKEGDRVGGGVLAFDTTIRLDQVTVTDCKARFGGGLYMRNSVALGQKELPGSLLTDCTISNCTASDMKLAGGGGAFLKNCYPTFRAVRFASNRSLGAFSCGGGLSVGVGGRAILDDCKFDSNSATAEGGGIYVYNARDTGDRNTSGVGMTNVILTGNTASGSGGGMMVQNSCVALRNVIFRSNRLAVSNFSASPHCQGGGLCIKLGGAPLASTLLFENCSFIDNSCEGNDPVEDARKRDFSGGGLHIGAEYPLKMNLVKLEFESNRAAAGKHLSIPEQQSIAGWSGEWDAQSTFVSPPLIDQSAIYRIAPRKRTTFATSPPVDWVSMRLPTTCFDNRPQGEQIDTVVLHFISARALSKDAYDLQTIRKIFLGDYPGAPGPTSAHYLIDRQGAVYGLVPESERAWHAGESMMADGRSGVNAFSIGIEIVRLAEEPPTAEQWTSLVGLLSDLKRRHPRISLPGIVGHDSIRLRWNVTTGKPAPIKDDPGPMFDWMFLAQQLSEADFSNIK